MRRICVSVAILPVLIGLLLMGPARATLLADQPYRFDDYGRVVTDVVVDGQGPFTFVIDTASSRSLIYEHVRAQLGLAQSGTQLLTIYGINDTATAIPVRPKELRVAGEAIAGLTIGVVPEEADPAGEPDGVLGIDMLARYFVVLDRTAMRFKLLTPGPGAARDYADWAQVPLMPHPLKDIPLEFWYVRAKFNGIALTTLLDLGAGETLFNWQAAELLGVHRNNYRKTNLPDALRDVLGSTAPVVRIRGLDISVPGMLWRNQSVLVSAAPVFSWFNLDERPAAIAGPGLLKDNSLAIDFAERRLFVGPAVDEPR